MKLSILKTNSQNEFSKRILKTLNKVFFLLASFPLLFCVSSCEESLNFQEQELIFPSNSQQRVQLVGISSHKPLIQLKKEITSLERTKRTSKQSEASLIGSSGATLLQNMMKMVEPMCSMATFPNSAIISNKS